MWKLAIFLFLSLIFLPSCGGKKEEREKRYARVYAEVLFLNEKFKSDSLKLKEKIDSVLNANGMRLSEIDSFVQRKSRKPESWANFFDEVKRYLDEKSLELQSSKHR